MPPASSWRTILRAGTRPPGPEDVVVGRAMVEVGRLLDIEVLDHVILSSTGFVSLEAKGLGF
jgi:DNA repair protein RadC